MNNAFSKAYSFIKEGLCGNCSTRDKNTLQRERSINDRSNKLETILDKKLFETKEVEKRSEKSKIQKKDSVNKELSIEIICPDQLALLDSNANTKVLTSEDHQEDDLASLGNNKNSSQESKKDEQVALLPKPKPRKIEKLLKQSCRIRKQKGTPWQIFEDKLLIDAVKTNNFKNWKEISKMVPGRSSTQCSQRWRRIQPYKNREPWTKAEDKILLELVKNYGKNWSLIASNLEGRTGKQVRERFLNCLNPLINRRKFSQEEDEKIVEFYKGNGPKWKTLSGLLEGRTENMVKNRFYSYLKRKYSIEDFPPAVFEDKIFMDIEHQSVDGQKNDNQICSESEEAGSNSKFVSRADKLEEIDIKNFLSENQFISSPSRWLSGEGADEQKLI